jgi:hypothetical protein
MDTFDDFRILDHLAINLNKIKLNNITFDTCIPIEGSSWLFWALWTSGYYRFRTQIIRLNSSSGPLRPLWLCTTESNIRLRKDVSAVPHFTPQVLELIRNKNNLKNTLTKRRRNGDVHYDSYNSCSRTYEKLCSNLTKLKQQEKRKLNHRHRRFENPKTGRKTWIGINNATRQS